MTERRTTVPIDSEGLRFSRRLSAMHIAGIGGLILVVIASVLYISREHDRFAAASSERMVRGGIAAIHSKYEGVVRDYSVWDEAYQAILRSDDEWLYSNVGTGSAEIGALDLIVLHDPVTGTDRGWVEGTDVPGEPDLLPPEIMKTALGLLAADGDRSAAEPFEARSTFARMDGATWIFSVTRVRPVNLATPSRPEEDLPVQIQGLRITDEVVGRIAANMQMDQLELSVEPMPGQISVDLTDAAGESIDRIVWTPPQPGMDILRKVALPLLGALLLASIFAALISRSFVRAAKDLEAALTAAQAADRSKTEFLANVSHELRTPMNGIIGVSQLLAMSELDEEQAELVEALDTSAKLQMDLITDLLDLTSVESGSRILAREPFEPAAEIAEMARSIRPTADAKGLALSVDCADLEDLTVVSDARVFRQIVVNLLGNAVKFTPQGQVALAARTVETDHGHVLLTVEVSDTGPGIAPELHDAIFGRFYQVDSSDSREAGGTGLGLAICRSMATLMGGRISVRSATGEGATFVFEVKMPRAEPARTARMAA
jgi:signal transduction histidine kinase